MKPYFYAVALLLGALQGLAQAATPLAYSGRLVDASGAPVAGPVAANIRFFKSVSGNDQVGPTKNFPALKLTEGLFQAQLDLSDADQDQIFGDGTYSVYVELEAKGVKYPRQTLSYVPYAYRVPIDGRYLRFQDGKLSLTLDPVASKVLGTDSSGNLIWINNGSANDSAQLDGHTSAYDLDAGNLNAGTLSDARIPAGIMRDSEVNPNWDTAFADRLKWDGGATGLNAATGRTSLGLGSLATQDASSVNITGGSISGTAFANDAISGDKVNGGTISNFASTGIRDNGTATAVTIDAAGNVGIGSSAPRSALDVAGTIMGSSKIAAGGALAATSFAGTVRAQVPTGASGIYVATAGTAGSDQAVLNFVTKDGPTGGTSIADASAKGWSWMARGDAWTAAAAQNDLILGRYNGGTFGTPTMTFDYATDNVGSFEWINRETWSYTNWGSGEPNGGTLGQCVSLGDANSG